MANYLFCNHQKRRAYISYLPFCHPACYQHLAPLVQPNVKTKYCTTTTLPLTRQFYPGLNSNGTSVRDDHFTQPQHVVQFHIPQSRRFCTSPLPRSAIPYAIAGSHPPINAEKCLIPNQHKTIDRLNTWMKYPRILGLQTQHQRVRWRTTSSTSEQISTTTVCKSLKTDILCSDYIGAAT